MIVWHVTPQCNRVSIEKHGILRRYAAHPVNRVWMVDGTRLAWAIAHVSKRYKTDRVAAFKFHVPADNLRRWRRGIFFMEDNVKWSKYPLRAVHELRCTDGY